MTVSIDHNTDAHQFEYHHDGEVAVLAYSLSNGVISLTHTYVPSQWRSQGIAAQLHQAAFDFIRQADLHVRPLCSYSQSYVQRHPELHALKD